MQPEKLFISSAQQIGQKEEFLFCRKTLSLKNKEEKNCLPFRQNESVTKNVSDIIVVLSF